MRPYLPCPPVIPVEAGAAPADVPLSEEVSWLIAIRDCLSWRLCLGAAVIGKGQRRGAQRFVERCAPVVQAPLLAGKSPKGLFVGFAPLSVGVGTLFAAGIIAECLGVVKRAHGQMRV